MEAGGFCQLASLDPRREQGIVIRTNDLQYYLKSDPISGRSP